VEPEKTPSERAEDLISLLVPDWRPTPQQVLWAIRIVLLSVLVLGSLTLVGRPFDITLWQWLDLLIIPAVLAVGGYLFTRSENRATRVAAEQQSQDEALQAYLLQMGQMLLNPENPLRDALRLQQASYEDPSSLDPDQRRERMEERAKERSLAREQAKFARAQTWQLLPRLDGKRKGTVLRFLYESDLIGRWRQWEFEGKTYEEQSLPIVDLRDADLSGTDLSGADLKGASLRKTNLRKANLKGTQLRNADLSGAVMSRADLRGAKLISAELSGVGLAYANLHKTNLRKANLRGALLDGANLRQVRLTRTSLSGANLRGAEGISNEDLDKQAASLGGATMPNGQKYEDWLKDQEGRKEDG
jgi:uncharacterized protein YjbI with pentapeptide repeats